MRYGIKKKKKSGPDLAQSGPGYGTVPGEGPQGFQSFSVTGPSVSQASVSRPAWAPAPSDAALEDQYAAYDKQATGVKSGYLAQSRDLLKDYGFQEGSQAFTFGAVDPNNPFSKAALLKQSLERAQRGNTNSYAARGQLYSGALQRSQDKSLGDFQQGENTLLNALRANLGQLGQAYAGVDADLAAQKANAFESFLGRQIALRPADVDPAFDPTLPPISRAPAPVVRPRDTPRQGASRSLGVPKKKRRR